MGFPNAAGVVYADPPVRTDVIRRIAITGHGFIFFVALRIHSDAELRERHPDYDAPPH